jgi:serine/threonine protein kinase
MLYKCNGNNTLKLSYHNIDILIKNLDIFTNKYTILNPLKIHKKRCVYSVRDNKNNNIKVLKFILKTEITDENIKIYYFFMNNAHNNFCMIEDILETNMFIILVMNYIEGETMYNFFNKKVNTHIEHNKIIITLIKAVQYLHKNNIIHGDIKPHNIIITSDYTPVFIDYDMSKLSNNYEINVDKVFGTRFFISPELFFTKKITNKIDIWSLGMTIYLCIMNKYIVRQFHFIDKRSCRGIQ